MKAPSCRLWLYTCRICAGSMRSSAPPWASRLSTTKPSVRSARFLFTIESKAAVAMCRTKRWARTVQAPATRPPPAGFAPSVASAPASSASYFLIRCPGEFLTMARVVAYMDDLFFQMKLAETAKHLGLEAKVASNAESLLQLLDPLPALVIVDLNARSSPLEAVQRLRAVEPNLHVVGFLSHVETELAAKARSAGFDEVMPRSKFSMHLPQIL